MRVAIVISQTPPIASGVSRIATRLESGLRECGCEVVVFSASKLPRIFWGEYRFVNSLPLFREMLGQVPYNVVNIHGPVPTFSDVLLLLCCANRKRLGGARIVYTHHWDMDVSRITTPVTLIYNLLTRIVVGQVDMVITSTRAYGESFSLFVSAERRKVIPWGVDDCFLQPMIPKKAKTFTILYVGQLRPYKGVDVLLRASAHLRDCKVIIVGEGHCRDKYVQLANKLNLQNVIFKGRVTDEELIGLYASSHVIVLPSVNRLEAFGIVLLEGMGAGCVPVASHLPGVADVVGDVGFTFEVGNVSALVHVLKTLEANRPLFTQLSYKAWTRAQTYRWTATCKGYLSAFEDVCKQGSAAWQPQCVPASSLAGLIFPSPL